MSVLGSKDFHNDTFLLKHKGEIYLFGKTDAGIHIHLPRLSIYFISKDKLEKRDITLDVFHYEYTDYMNVNRLQWETGFGNAKKIGTFSSKIAFDIDFNVVEHHIDPHDAQQIEDFIKYNKRELLYQVHLSAVTYME